MIILFFLLVLLIGATLIHKEARVFLKAEFKWILIVSGIGFMLINSILLLLIIPFLAFVLGNANPNSNLAYILVSLMLSSFLIFLGIFYGRFVSGYKSFYFIVLLSLVIILVLIIIAGPPLIEAVFEDPATSVDDYYSNF